MTLNNGQKDKITKRRRIIADYRLKGIENTWELIDLLEKEHKITVSERTIYYDKEAIERQWLEASQQDNEKRKANIAQKYEYIHREAIAAWFKSLEDAETTIQELIEADNGEGTNGKGRLKASTRKEGQSGNPALLAQAQAALKALREMFGTDAAIKQRQVNLNIDFSKLTDEQVTRIAGGEDPIVVVSNPGPSRTGTAAADSDTAESMAG